MTTSQTRGFLAVASLVMLLTGCSSIGKGVAEALLQKNEAEDTRICQVWGQPFKGIDAGLSKTQGKTKVLMVHGVGDHIPGYTTEFLEKLAKQLNLNARSEQQKNISLSAPLIADKHLGNLRITHLFNEESHKELMFYELTWSEITRDEKQLLAFDNSGEYEFRRAKLNDMLKKFSNDTGPDPIIYLGQKREAILAAFSQSICWMATGDWQDLPTSGNHTCTGLDDSKVDHIIHDDYVFISHSLGSRITIDGMQRIAHILDNKAQYTDVIRKVGVAEKVIEALRNKEMPIFMLSNQLPMLQLGRELPEISGQRANYCQPDGAKYASRIFKLTPIIAFSDPNDLLSYGIPSGFSDKYLDSRLCTKITNVNINIANVIDAFGISDLANPLEAHLGYAQDDRVIALIAHGIGHQQSADLVKNRCEFTKTVE
ncbi:hypothetical protein [Methylomonas rosea]|uniref:Alpha/beta hydrolase n=1 Tax=Methylomonas rosea TaxID=2952227 RepID=A0ABT1TPM7_9GAMM|nr:hypothetical protein [Methylomonas sp. WSC-7]MCQ8116729.1 hypothetical protein [Methylomonas sp. WSC-7]